MVTTVKLQNPFEYSWWVVLIAAVVLVAALFAIVYVAMALYRARGKKQRPVPAARKILMTPESFGA